MKKFKKHGIPKDLMQEVFAEYIHVVDYILEKPKKKCKKKKKEVPTTNGRNSKEYTEWRQAVLDRDGHICRKCQSPFYIEVHHIKKYHDDPKNFDIENGISLCHECHTTEHKGE